VAENAPLSVACRLFRTTKLHSSRLDWCIFSHNRGGYERSTSPRKDKPYSDLILGGLGLFTGIVIAVLGWLEIIG